MIDNDFEKKKIVHEKLFAKVNLFNTSTFVLKAQYKTDKLGI